MKTKARPSASSNRELRLLVVCGLALALLTAGAALLHAEDPPMTLDQARQLVAADPEQAARIVVAFDRVLKERPQVVPPRFALVVSGTDATASALGPIVLTAVDGRVRWDVQLQPLLFPGTVPKDMTGEVVFWKVATALAAAVGFGLGYVAH